MKLSPNASCPCGSTAKYKRCCGALHRGVPAPSALALMRSRYAAYALGLAAYVMETTHPDSPHAQGDRAAWRTELEEFSAQTEFVGLEIVRREASADPDEAFVTFRARLTQAGVDASFTERSRFRRLANRWKYVDSIE